MLRKLMILLAFLAAFGQALAGASVSQAASTGMEHALVHAQAGQHHHHDDIGPDTGGAGGFHVHLDGANSAAALPPSGAPPAASRLAHAHPAATAPAYPSVTPDGLLRPPQPGS